MHAKNRRAAKMTLAAVALVATSFAILPAGLAQAAPGPRFGENYRLVSDTPATVRDVPGLAGNPANDNDPINGECDYHVSFDGGKTWKGGHLRARQGGENPPFPVPPCLQNFDSG